MCIAGVHSTDDAVAGGQRLCVDTTCRGNIQFHIFAIDCLCIRLVHPHHLGIDLANVRLREVYHFGLVG